MKRFVYTAALCVGLGLVSTSLAQPPGGGRPGFVPPKQQGSSSGDLERKLDRLDAQLKALEEKLSRVQAPQNRQPEPPRGPGGDRSRFGPGNPPGPGGFGQGFGNFGRGPGGPGTGTATGPARRDGGGNADFEKRLDHIIGELEQLKKDMKGGQRGGR
ncbi:MAG: hypothetical protein EXS09_20580 [Gemmataceae bacterium]|nr:hypothetical protein [Gemmataceae bacterium]